MTRPTPTTLNLLYPEERKLFGDRLRQIKATYFPADVGRGNKETHVYCYADDAGMLVDVDPYLEGVPAEYRSGTIQRDNIIPSPYHEGMTMIYPGADASYYLVKTADLEAIGYKPAVAA